MSRFGFRLAPQSVYSGVGSSKCLTRQHDPPCFLAAFLVIAATLKCSLHVAYPRMYLTIKGSFLLGTRPERFSPSLLPGGSKSLFSPATTSLSLWRVSSVLPSRRPHFSSKAVRSALGKALQKRAMYLEASRINRRKELCREADKVNLHRHRQSYYEADTSRRTSERINDTRWPSGPKNFASPG